MTLLCFPHFLKPSKAIIIFYSSIWRQHFMSSSYSPFSSKRFVFWAWSYKCNQVRFSANFSSAKSTIYSSSFLFWCGGRSVPYVWKFPTLYPPKGAASLGGISPDSMWFACRLTWPLALLSSIQSSESVLFGHKSTTYNPWPGIVSMALLSIYNWSLSRCSFLLFSLPPEFLSNYNSSWQAFSRSKPTSPLSPSYPTSYPCHTPHSFQLAIPSYSFPSSLLSELSLFSGWKPIWCYMYQFINPIISNKKNISGITNSFYLGWYFPLRGKSGGAFHGMGFKGK